MWIIAQGHESIFSPGLRWRWSSPAILGLTPSQVGRTRRPKDGRRYRGCNPIGVHRAFRCQSCHPGVAGMSQPTRPFPQGTISDIRLSIEYGSRLSDAWYLRAGSRRVVSGDPSPRVGMTGLRTKAAIRLSWTSQTETLQTFITTPAAGRLALKDIHSGLLHLGAHRGRDVQSCSGTRQ
jgi:hypothetical protein